MNLRSNSPGLDRRVRFGLTPLRGRILAATFVAMLVAGASAVIAAEDPAEDAETWTINSPSVDMLQFITQVADITGKTFVIDPRIKGTVSVVSRAALDKD